MADGWDVVEELPGAPAPSASGSGGWDVVEETMPPALVAPRGIRRATNAPAPDKTDLTDVIGGTIDAVVRPPKTDLKAANELAREQVQANPQATSLSGAELRQRQQGKTARETYAQDPWRAVAATVESTPGMARQIMGGALRAVGEGPLAKIGGQSGAIDYTGEFQGTTETLGDLVARFGADVADQGKVIEEEANRGIKRGLGTQAIDTAYRSALMAIPAVAVGVATRNPALVVSIMAGEDGALSYQEAREKGLNPQQAGGYAFLHALIEGGTEYIPMKELLKSDKNVLRHALMFLAKEQPSEMAATTLQSALDKLTINPGMTARDFANDLMLTAISTPLSAGAQSGAVRVLQDLSAANPIPEPAAPPVAPPTMPMAPAAGLPPPPPEPPPSATAAADLRGVLADPRPLDTIRQEEAQQAEAQAAAVQAQAATDAGFPDIGTPMVAKTPAGPLSGAVESVEQGMDGPLAVFRAADGQVYRFAPGEVQFDAPEGDGTRAAPVVARDAQDVARAAQMADTEATPAQKLADNYQKAWFTFADDNPMSGLGRVAIETPKGATRVAADGSWSVPNMPAHYGHLSIAKGNDGDGADVHIGEDLQAPTVYVIDQIDPDTGRYDETKSFIGFPNENAAVAAYVRGFSDGRGADRIGALTPMPVAQFIARARADNLRNAIAYVEPSAESRELADYDVGLTQVVEELADLPSREATLEEFMTAIGFTDAEIQEAISATQPATEESPQAPAGQVAENVADATPQGGNADGAETGTPGQEGAAGGSVGAEQLSQPEPVALQEQGNAPGAQPATPNLIRIRDVYGTYHWVTRKDLDNPKRTFLRRHNPDGTRIETKGKGVIHRENIDPDGSAAKEAWKDLSFFDGPTGNGFASKPALVNAIKRKGQDPADFDIRETDGRYLAIRKSIIPPAERQPITNGVEKADDLLETQTSAPTEPKKPAKKTTRKDPLVAIREFYTPGNIIFSDYWRSHDRVLAFREDPQRGWEVQVEEVAKKSKNGPWEAVKPARWHSTAPDAKDVVVERAAAAPAAPEPAKQSSGRTEIGKNSKGATLYEDARGVRTLVRAGESIGVQETVELIPTREGMKISRGERRDEYKTVEELAAEKPSTAAPNEATSETARRGEFMLKSGERAKVLEQARRGVFNVYVGKSDGTAMESMGQFQMDDQFDVSRIEARAQWATDNVRDAAMQFALQQRGETQPNAGAEAPSGMTLQQARDTLADMKARSAAQGRISDSRLDEQIRKFQKLVEEMEAEAARAKQPAVGTESGKFKVGDRVAFKATGTRGKIIDLFTSMRGSSAMVLPDGSGSAISAVLSDLETEPIAPKEPAKSPEQLRAEADLAAGLADLADIFGKNAKLNMLPEQQQKIGPVLTRVFDAAFRLGYVKFKQAAKFVLDTIRARIGADIADQITIDDLQGAYIGMAQNYRDKGADSKKDVINVETLADLETAPESAQNAPQEPTDERTAPATRDVDRPGKGTLGGAPSQDVRAPGGVETPAAGTDRSGGSDNGRAADAGESGVQPAGGLGTGEGAVPIPPARTRGQRKPRAKPGVRGDDGLQPDLGLFGTLDANPAPNAAPIVPPAFQPQDFTITEDLALGEGGQKQKYRQNVDAIRLLRELERTGRHATPDEQRALALYVGWGGLAQAFDESNQKWAAEYAELKALLDEGEYDDARRSTRYAHYTSREIIQDGIYAALRHFGFTGGKLLESSGGVGNFLGLMPADMRTASRFTMIEREPIAVGIAKQLYPQQNVISEDFTFFKGTDGYFDVAPGNPPFASDPQTDRSGRRYLNGMSLHNYFFAKTVDMLREGGILAQVVTSGFLDARRDTARSYIADRVEFLGAIRLPNNAFQANAGTEVTTDLIFLKKRPESEWGSKKAKDDAKRWLDAVEVPDSNGGESLLLSRYFVDNPDMMLGRFGRYGTMYGPGQPALVAKPGQDTGKLLREAVKRLPADVYVPAAVAGTTTMENRAIVALKDSTVQEGGYYVDGDRLYQRQPDMGGETSAVELTPKTPWTEKQAIGDLRFARLKALAELRRTLRTLIAMEKDGDSGMEAQRKRLNEQYDAYVKAHGYINDRATAQVFDDDPDYPLLAALETDYTPPIGPAAAKAMGIKPVPSSAKKMPIFERPVVENRKPVEKVESPSDAIAVSIAERGAIDSAFVAQLLGRDADGILEDLAKGENPVLFLNPATNDYVLRDEYLSGNVRRKLAQAKESGMFDNVAALEKVVPPDVGAHEISARIGSPWIPETVYEDFAKELFGEGTVAGVRYAKANSSYLSHIVAGNDVLNTNKWGIPRYHGTDLLNALMNNREIKVVDYDSDRKPHLNKEATEQANVKAQEIRDRFNDWLFADATRSELLVRAYNDTNNNYVTRQYDGAWARFPGKVPDSIIKFRRHQRNAIARILQSRTALLDHVVGAGKTFTMVSAAMELKRTGLAKKPMIAVPNHLVKQWAADFYRLYPGANILTATKKDFERANRRRFLAKIATGDWDAVIIAHSSFGFIKPDAQFEAEFSSRQVKKIEETIKAVDDSNMEDRAKKRTVKQLEALKERIENRIKSLRDKPVDQLLDFGEIGVDQLFVDEAHLFKNLMFTTKMQNIRGLGDSKGSQRAYDMYLKVNQIYARNGRQQGVVFATGTPVSNSLAEMYHMMRYLMPETMEELGFESFDAWANTFAAVSQQWDQKPGGDGFKAINTMSDFVNTHELLRVFDQVSDTVTMEDIKAAFREENDGKEFPLPKLKTGRRQPVSLKKSPAQVAYMQDIAKRAQALENRKGPPKKGEDNHLVVMTDARKAAMDIRLVDLNLTEREPGGRIDAAAERIVERYRQWDKHKGTQLVFSDLGTPIKTVKKELAEYEELTAAAAVLQDESVTSMAALGDEDAIRQLEDAQKAQDELDAKGPDWKTAIQAAMRGFSVYDDLRAALIERGIPEAEIAFIHDYNTDEQKAGLFRKMNAGAIRVLLGSTAKLGAGTNVQQRLVALHHLDVPWKPSDIEQREGRIIRQGNKLQDQVKDFEAEILAYVTQDTLDMKMWMIQERKLKMINQLRSRQIERVIENSFEDMEMSAGEMQAAATGNMDLLREIQLRADVKKLEQKKRAYEAQRNDLISRTRRAEEQVDRLPKDIKAAEPAAAAAQRYRDGLATEAFKPMTVDGKTYDTRADAARAVRDAIESYKAKKEEFKKQGVETDLKFSVEINGTKYTAMSKASDAFVEQAGDAEPIEWRIDGDTLNRRAKVRAAILPAVTDSVDLEEVRDIGTIGEFSVTIEAQTNRRGEVFLDLRVRHKASGHESAADVFVPKPAEEDAPVDLGHVADRVIITAERMVSRLPGEADYARMRLKGAERELKELRAAPSMGEWPLEGELKRAREAHRDVLKRLSSGKVATNFETLYGFEPGADVDMLAPYAARGPSDRFLVSKQSGRPVFTNRFVELGDSEQLGPNRYGWRIFSRDLTDEAGDPLYVGFVIADYRDGKFTALNRIEIDDTLRGRGLGETVVASMLRHNGPGVRMDVNDIEHAKYRGTKRDPLPFWRKIGTRITNFSSDPDIPMDGFITLEDYRDARQQGSPQADRGVLGEDAQARRGRDGATQEGRAGRGEAIRQTRAELVNAFGEDGVAALEASGLLHITTFANAPKGLRDHLQADEFAAYWPGHGAYIFADNARPGMAPALLLHEIGEHYGLEGMLGAARYAALMEEVKALHAKGDAGIGAAWEHVRTYYPDAPGSRRFMQEVIAKAGQDADVRRSSWWQRLIDDIRAFLLKIGVKKVGGERDLQVLLAASLRKAMRDAKDVVPVRMSDIMVALSDEAPVWRSALVDAIKAGKLGSMPAAQWKAFLNGLTTKGVKPDELQWSGIFEWLDLQSGKVTREAVLDYLRAGGVKVETTVLSDSTARKLPSGWSVHDNGDGTFSVLDESGDEMSEGATVDEAIGNAQDEDQYAETPGAPKFGNWKLPGGDEYREVLMTLPEAPGARKALEEARQRNAEREPKRKAVFEKYRADILKARQEADTAARFGTQQQRDAAWQRMTELENQRDAEAREVAGEMEDVRNIEHRSEFRSTHWDQPNVVAHFRADVVTGADGKRYLRAFEFQSDWGQKGKREGFDTAATGQALAALNQEADTLRAEALKINSVPYEQLTAAQAMRLQDIDRRLDAISREKPSKTGIPAAPFVTKTEAWLSLAIKRAIRMAADEGLDGVVFANGEQMADLFDLSKQVDKIDYYTRSGQTMVAIFPIDESPINLVVVDGVVGNAVKTPSQFVGKKLDEVVGKDVADKILNDPNDGTITGNGLRMGGEGMRAFYDKIVPNVANDVLRKLGGGKVGPIPLQRESHGGQPFVVERDNGGVLGRPGFATRAEAAAWIAWQPRDIQRELSITEVSPNMQPGFPITDALRSNVMQGLPLFARLGDQSDDAPMASRGQKAVESASKDLTPPRTGTFESPFGGDRPFDSDLSLFRRIAVHPRMIASLEGEFAPVYRVAESQVQRRDELAAEILKHAQPYFDLPEESKRKVNAVLEIGRLQGRTFGGDELMQVSNMIESDAILSQPDELITLNEREVRGYKAVRRAMDRALDLFAERMIEEFGQTGVVRTAQDAASLAIKRAESDPRESNRLARLAEILFEVEQAKRSGYIPFTRWGEVGISIKDSDGNLLAFERVEVNSVVEKARRMGENLLPSLFNTRRLAAIPAVKDRLEALKARYPDATVRVFRMDNPQAGAQVDLAALDSLAAVASIEPGQWEQVRDQLERAKQTAGFRRHFLGSANVPGYSGDFERATADYILGIAGYLSRHEHTPRWERAIGDIDTAKSSLIEYAKRYRDYVNKPQEELQGLRQAAFFYFLSGVPATAMVNLTQVPLITMPYLTQFANPVTVNAELARAYKDALAMMTTSRGVEMFDPQKAPPDMLDAFRHAWEQGFFVPLQTYEIMGLAQNRSPVTRGLSKATRTVVDVVSLMFSIAERVNRMATFIAAHRLARDKDVRSKARTVLAANPLARRELRRVDPEGFAEWVIDETHFRMGKVNRPEMMRGVGAAILQFKGFMLNTLELYDRMGRMHGREGKIAVAIMLVLLWMAGGYYALPGAEDWDDLLEFLMKRWKGMDYDTKAEARQAIAELTGSPKLAEIFLHGVPRAWSTGPELSARLGLGNVVPDTAKDVAGVPLSLTVGKAVQAGEYASRGQHALAVAELMPNFIRNPMTAYVWGQQGIRAQSTGKVVVPAEKVTAGQQIQKAIGFTPAKVAEFRELQSSKNRLEHAVDEKRKTFYTRMARAQADLYRAEQVQDLKAIEAARTEIEKISKEIYEWNADADVVNLIVFDPRTMRQRVAEELIGPDARKRRRQSRPAADRLERAFGMDE